MEQRRIGAVAVSAIGLGAMPLSVRGHPDEERARATIHAALDAGVTLIDTADAYSPDSQMGHNENIVARALATYGGDASPVMVATKGGHTRPDGDWVVDGRPDHLRRACEQSLRRLGVDAIALYQHHRPDPSVPYAETMGGLRELLDAGLIERAGISNADPDQIREARDILGDDLVSVQNQLSPTYRSSLAELELTDELGLAFLPWSPLGGIGSAKDLGSTSQAFAAVADKYEVSPQQVCLAWLLALSPRVIPIPGASRVESIRDSAAAVHLDLDEEDLEALNAT
ncbi:MAG: aldo/keto reductase [Nocardioidaceae bacterium]|nr:aldo/keto reductase [Nocardioidaceae bacterium]